MALWGGDAAMDGTSEESESLHRDRFLVGELLYIDEVDPRSFVEVVVDNTRFDHPRIVARGLTARRRRSR